MKIDQDDDKKRTAWTLNTVGGDVEEGLIDKVGSLNDAIEALYDLIDEQE